MKTWFTSDLHFGHRGIIDFCERPWPSVEAMDEGLIALWNMYVLPEDTVYILGDVSFHKPYIGLLRIGQLAGRKILVQGNHDKYSATQYRSVFAGIVDEAIIHLQGKRFRLSHYPYAPEDTTGIDPHDLRYMDRRPPRKGHSYLLHGHVHQNWKHQGNQINVGVDVWGYKPVSEGALMSYIAANAL